LRKFGNGRLGNANNCVPRFFAGVHSRNNELSVFADEHMERRAAPNPRILADA
jgi:hypothetical protein